MTLCGHHRMQEPTTPTIDKTNTEIDSNEGTAGYKNNSHRKVYI